MAKKILLLLTSLFMANALYGTSPALSSAVAIISGSEPFATKKSRLDELINQNAFILYERESAGGKDLLEVTEMLGDDYLKEYKYIVTKRQDMLNKFNNDSKNLEKPTIRGLLS